MVKLFVYFITLQSFQHDMYNVTHFQTLRNVVVKEKGSKVNDGYLKVEVKKVSVQFDRQLNMSKFMNNLKEKAS